MGRPIKKKFIGDQKGSTEQSHYIVCDAWVATDTANRINAKITRQKASNEYRVDSSGVGGPALSAANGSSKGYLCKLVNGLPAAAGQMSIAVDPYVAPTGAATFAVTMEVNSATLVSGGGTGTAYNPGDVLTVVGGTGTSATITVNTVSAGGVATFTLTTKGSYTALPVNPVSVTDATTPGATPSATFNLKYDVKSVTVGGTNTGYGANTEVVFNGGGYTTQATATATVVGGAIQTPLTMVLNGVGYTSIPTVTALSFGPTQYARKLNNRTVETFAGNRYKWELTGTELTGTGTANGPNTQGVQTLGQAFIQSV
jgi:hypothetical protein